jgi:hypothetical protein
MEQSLEFVGQERYCKSNVQDGEESECDEIIVLSGPQ